MPRSSSHTGWPCKPSTICCRRRWPAAARRSSSAKSRACPPALPMPWPGSAGWRRRSKRWRPAAPACWPRRWSQPPRPGASAGAGPRRPAGPLPRGGRTHRRAASAGQPVNQRASRRRLPLSATSPPSPRKSRPRAASWMPPSPPSARSPATRTSSCRRPSRRSGRPPRPTRRWSTWPSPPPAAWRWWCRLPDLRVSETRRVSSRRIWLDGITEPQLREGCLRPGRRPGAGRLPGRVRLVGAAIPATEAARDAWHAALDDTHALAVGRRSWATWCGRWRPRVPAGRARSPPACWLSCRSTRRGPRTRPRPRAGATRWTTLALGYAASAVALAAGREAAARVRPDGVLAVDEPPRTARPGLLRARGGGRASLLRRRRTSCGTGRRPEPPCSTHLPVPSSTSPPTARPAGASRCAAAC